MPANLYLTAQASLPGKDKPRLNQFLQWLEAIAEPQLDGARLAENIRQEAHLVGNNAFNTPDEFKQFLGQCASLHRGTNAQKREAYSRACGNFQSRGLRIAPSDLPERLLRYSTNRKLIARIVEKLLGTVARKEFDDERMLPADAFSRLANAWDAFLASTESLGGREAVFATFGDPSSAPRDDARAMADALALPIVLRVGAGNQILFEFSYRRDDVLNHRFPTVADAEFCHLFQPAPELIPTASDRHTLSGWTRPLAAQPEQPEILHQNASLQVLAAAPRLVGRMTL
jgi:hypothetical protein